MTYSKNNIWWWSPGRRHLTFTIELLRDLKLFPVAVILKKMCQTTLREKGLIQPKALGYSPSLWGD